MRYLLLVLGLLGLIVGFIIYESNTDTRNMTLSAVIMASGAVLLAAGAATVDIVEAIKANQR